MNVFDRLAAKPLFMCSFRPFFLVTAIYGVALLLGWLGFLAAGVGVPAVPGGPIVWHAHELVFGFGLAAVAGFVLTAVPEFTSTAAFGRRVTIAMLLLWAGARLAFWLSGAMGSMGEMLAALLNSGFMAALVVLVAPRLWHDPERRHLSFLWGLAAMWLAVTGFHADVLRGVYPMPWVLAGVGMMMVLIIVALSRVSMRIVNDALEAERLRRAAQYTDGRTGGLSRRPDEDDDELLDYRARPPRRNLAIFGVALYTAVALALPGSAISGWIALAAAAAVLNLLNDWHVGRALLSRWALMLYTVYWSMALGYALIGLSLLGVPVAPSAGLHLLTVGAMGVSIFGVLCIAGRTHAGYALDTRPWVQIAAVAIGVAALVRAASGLPGAAAAGLQAMSVVAWAIGYGLAAVFLGAVFVRARPDAGTGCEEVMEDVDAKA
ncbi:NnrS family protein [Thauera linaloolentis]|uniref:Nnrs family protein n=1 Tax=Thauera linaloolentis (strain DSM 12138 / JCM 21573 / CCUG 41526 / CIP 105981 / IAM 15112 / NBRC 102519 / 47Lol) TaxID=1123367 RepID=N6Z2N7_THAL4|nr:NnrS family protein [Thauera linaloolentis]ENO88643.1 nnrs family protein [Thauera linaloolentis 47Lol = DSM 12138]MCM8565688.1 NnrS family protein [Thauera linaloolentis]